MARVEDCKFKTACARIGVKCQWKAAMLAANKLPEDKVDAGIKYIYQNPDYAICPFKREFDLEHRIDAKAVAGLTDRPNSDTIAKHMRKDEL